MRSERNAVQLDNPNNPELMPPETGKLILEDGEHEDSPEERELMVRGTKASADMEKALQEIEAQG